MRKAAARWKQICSVLAKIHIVDKFLIVFMILLMVQSVHSLFSSHTVSGESAHIDIIVRTSAAAIFGYFLSTNFIRHTSYTKDEDGGSLENHAKSMPGISREDIQNRIGFAVPKSEGPTDTPYMGNVGYNENPSPNEFGVNRLQIIITSIIGLFCLVVLIVARDVSALNADMEVSASASATGAQFRDFVSGCIGFLIGSPTSNTNKLK